MIGRTCLAEVSDRVVCCDLGRLTLLLILLIWLLIHCVSLPPVVTPVLTIILLSVSAVVSILAIGLCLTEAVLVLAEIGLLIVTVAIVALIIAVVVVIETVITVIEVCWLIIGYGMRLTVTYRPSYLVLSVELVVASAPLVLCGSWASMLSI